MKPTSRRKFLKSVTAASVVSTLGGTAQLAKAASVGSAGCSGYAALETAPVEMENTLGIIGDQVTAKFYYKSIGAASETVKYMANGYITWALALSGQRLRIVANPSRAGTMVTGADIDNGFKKQLQDCLAAQVSDIICMGGQQDLINGVSLDAVKNGWLNIIQTASCANKRVWWLTQTPVDICAVPLSVRASIYQLNAWIIGQAANFPNLQVIDAAAAVSTTVTSGGYTYQTWLPNTCSQTDRYTPINTGAYTIGSLIAQRWAGLANTFQLASDPLDDIQGDPRSLNIIHNSLMTDIGVNRVTALVGGSGYQGDRYGYFPLVFSGGAGSGAVGRALVRNGAISAVEIQHSGIYTSAPTISFEKGLGSGASAIAQLGVAGFTYDTGVTESQVARSDNFGCDASLDIDYPAWQAKMGLGYFFTQASEMINHLGPQDIFTVRCAVSNVAPPGSRLTGAGPCIKCFGTTTRIYDSCGESPDDMPLSAFKDAVFVTPPMAHVDAGNISVYLYAANDQTWAANAKATVRFGRVSCLVTPSKVITPVVKDVVKFHPGHYVTVYNDWNYSTFPKQDSFNTGVVQGNVTTAAWSGVEKQIRWATVEPTPGVYDITMITNWITGLREWNTANPGRNPKRLMLYLLSDSYNAPSPGYLPDYILNGRDTDGSTYYYVHAKGAGKKLKYFSAYVQQRLIALGQALAAAFDNEPLFEAYRMDETSPGDTLAGLYPTRLTDYVEGQVQIAAEINRAFKQTMFIMGVNFVADQKLSRATRMFIQAGVGMGVVDLVQTDTSLTAAFASYDHIKAASPYVPSVAHFDGGNYLSNTTVPQDLRSVIPFAYNRANVSHICWYRRTEGTEHNYWTLTQTLNAIQSDWDSVAGRSYGLSTTRPSSIN